MADRKKWFKVWTSLLTDMDNRTAEEVGHWTRLGCRIALVGNHGTVVFEGWEHVARFFGVTVEVARDLLNRLPSIQVHDADQDTNQRHGRLAVTMQNWTRYQEDTTQAERQSKSRSKKRGEENRGDENFREVFESFWTLYPRKVSKTKAWESWRRLKPTPEEVEKIIQAVKDQTASPQWTRDNGQFIPHPSTWLNQRRWDDQEPTPGPARLGSTPVDPKEQRRLDQAARGAGFRDHAHYQECVRTGRGSHD